jgi:hypothetical protein
LRAPCCSTDEQSMAREECDFLAGEWPGFDFENDSHRRVISLKLRLATTHALSKSFLNRLSL